MKRIIFFLLLFLFFVIFLLIYEPARVLEPVPLKHKIQGLEVYR